jgi:hypothetical protein
MNAALFDRADVSHQDLVRLRVHPEQIFPTILQDA